MGSRCLLTPFILIVLALPAGAAQVDQPDPRGVDKDAVKRWMTYYKQIAHEYDIRLEGHPDEQLKPSAQAIHHFVYAAHSTKPHGAFYVWTREGRPEAIGAIWTQLAPNSKTRRNVIHDLHSLSTGRLTGRWRTKVFWTPKSAGVQFMQIPKSKPPAKSSGLRLAQMRSMVRGFKGYIILEEKRVPLRLLSQPLYRYESTNSEVLDGAIFGLFDGWDPEILLLVEARKAKGKTEWSVAPVPFAGKHIALEFADAEFWDYRDKTFWNRNRAFYAPRVEVLDAQLNTKTQPQDDR